MVPNSPFFNWLNARAAGVMLHPTSLPGGQGIGTFDAHVGRFLDFLEAAGMAAWQICPLGPTGFGDSPYQCFSAFAGNPNLIDLRELVEHELLEAAEITPLSRLGAEEVDFGGLYGLKWPLLRRAAERHAKLGAPPLGPESFSAFKSRHAGWLDAYALFRALKDHHGGRPWTEWPESLRKHTAAFRSPLAARLAPECEAHRFYQYAFFQQWQRVRAEAKRRGIAVIGDIPIFVAADSSDVWSHPELFEINPKTGLPSAGAGVPPDYFSEDGQFWGNPLYRWEAHAADGFAWWRERLRSALAMHDIVRIDHFRGFDAYWRVQLPASNARVGKWLPGPGIGLFRALHSAMPGAKIIAEDLGIVTDSVTRLREQAGFPGMAVLQFAFGGDAANPYLPHNLVANQVIYPGTHDNDTSLGWYASADEPARDHVRRYLRVDGGEIGWDLIRSAYGAVSRLAVVTLQDILSLGAEGRFNSPGRAEGNWRWRFREDQLEALFARTAPYLRELGTLTGRCPSPGFFAASG